MKQEIFDKIVEIHYKNQENLLHKIVNIFPDFKFELIQYPSDILYGISNDEIIIKSNYAIKSEEKNNEN